jgi:hypothetical protein
MKIEVNTELKDLDGTTFKVRDKKDGPERALTLKDVALMALCTSLEEDRQINGKVAFERRELARKINAGGEVDLDPADAALIQDRLPKVYPILIAGTAYELLKG